MELLSLLIQLWISKFWQRNYNKKLQSGLFFFPFQHLLIGRSMEQLPVLSSQWNYRGLKELSINLYFYPFKDLFFSSLESFRISFIFQFCSRPTKMNLLHSFLEENDTETSSIYTEYLVSCIN